MAELLTVDEEMSKLSLDKIGPKRTAPGDEDADKKKTPAPKKVSAPVITLYSTGMLVGEHATIKGEGKLKTARIRLVAGFIPPNVNEATTFPDQEQYWNDVFALVSGRPGMIDVDALKVWHKAHAVDKVRARDGVTSSYQTLSQLPADVRIVFEAIDPDDASIIGEENMAKLLSGPMHPWDALRLFTPAGAGATTAEGHRRRLVMLVKYWKLVPVTRRAAPSAMDVDDDDSDLVVVSAAVPGRLVPDSLIFDMNFFPPHVSRSTGAESEAQYVHRATDENEHVYILPDATAVANSGASAVFGDAYARLYLKAERTKNPISRELAERLERTLMKLSPSIIKSLLQKIIRAAPTHVQLDANDLPTGLFRAQDVLIYSCIALMKLPNAFNPSVGTSERGLHAFVKRTIITCYEDAWPEFKAQPLMPLKASKSEPVARGVEAMLYFGMLQLMLMDDPKWWPSEREIVGWIDVALACQQSPRFWKYENKKGAPSFKPADIGYNVATAGQQTMYASFLLDKFVKGMSGDRAMVADIAKQLSRGEKFRTTIVTPWPPENRVMGGWHMIDQHAAPAMVYLFDPKGSVYKHARASPSARSAKPWGDTFSTLFANVTGLNPRRENLGTRDFYGRGTRPRAVGVTDAFVDEVVATQRTQWTIWLSASPYSTDEIKEGQQADAVAEDDDDDIVTISRLQLKLPEEWISYAFSTQTADVRTDKAISHFTYMIAPSDQTIRVVRDPKVRGKKSTDVQQRLDEAAARRLELLDEQLNKLGRDRVLEKIRSGEQYTARAGSFAGTLPKISVVLEGDGDSLDNVSFLLNGKPWNESRTLTFDLPDGPVPRVRPGNIEALNTHAYLQANRKWNQAGTIAAIREGVAQLGVSAAGVLLAVAMLRSFETTLEFVVPARDGGSPGNQPPPSLIGFEACQVCKVVAAHFGMVLRPGVVTFENGSSTLARREREAGIIPDGDMLNYDNDEDDDGAIYRSASGLQPNKPHSRPNRFLTLPSMLPLRQLIASAIDPTMAGMSVEQLIADNPAQLMPSDQFATLIQDMNTKWRGGKDSKRLFDHQRYCIETLLVRANFQRRRHNFMNMPVGSGKTNIAAAFYYGLLKLYGAPNNVLTVLGAPSPAAPGVANPRFEQDGMFMLVATTGSASAAVLGIMQAFFGNERVEMLKKVPRQDRVAPARFVGGQIYVIVHDVLRSAADQFMPYMSRALFVLDEAHMATGDSWRTEAMLSLGLVSLHTLFMTGTPLRSKRDEAVLRAMVQMGERIPCLTPKDFIVALGDVVQAAVVNGVVYDDDGNVINEFRVVPTEERQIRAIDLATPNEKAALLQSLPERMGGTNPEPRVNDVMFRAAYAAAQKLCIRVAVEETIRLTKTGRRVLIAGENAARVREIYQMIMERGRFANNEVYMHVGNNVSPVGLDNMSSTYKVVIMPQSVNTGYSAIICNEFITTVNMSNEADRTQLRGRLTRPGQTAEVVNYTTIHAGITTFMFENHLYARTVNDLIDQINKKESE